MTSYNLCFLLKNIYMLFLDLTLPTPEENVALDEALLEASEAGELPGEILRLWEPSRPFVVLGRSSDPAVEVNMTVCQREKIPVLRRASGGGTILAGPGCLMYAVVLALENYPEARFVTAAHRIVLERIARSLGPLVDGVTLAGTSDLALSQNGRLQKFSGNAMRIKRDHLLYHGTLLYDFDLAQVGELLASQTREPRYRAGRTHDEFIANLPLTRAQLVAALVDDWQATEPFTSWPKERMTQIIREKYSDDPKWIV